MTAAVAMNEITLMFMERWGARPVELPNTNFVAPADDSTTWAAISFEHTDAGQSALANVENKRRYTNDGVCLIELFFPLGAGVIGPYEEAEGVCSLFRGKHTPSDVWFRNVRMIEHSARHGNPPRHKNRYQIDVVFDFTYDGIS